MTDIQQIMSTPIEDPARSAAKIAAKSAVQTPKASEIFQNTNITQNTQNPTGEVETSAVTSAETSAETSTETSAKTSTETAQNAFKTPRKMKISVSDSKLSSKRTRQHSTSSSIQSMDFDYSKSCSLEQKEVFERVAVAKHAIKRNLPKVYHDNNVLVLGARNVGKSSLINSIWLAMTGESEERSPPVGVTFHLGCHKLYGREAKYSRDRGVRLPGGSVNLWDTRGIHLVHDEEKVALILQYLLEGRLEKSFFHQALILPVDKIKARFHNTEVSTKKHWKAVIFVERKDADGKMQQQTERLGRILQLALSRSKFNSIKNLPVLRTLNGAGEEVKKINSTLKMNRSSLSSTESLNEVGLPKQVFPIESYQWRIEYESFDEEGFGNNKGESVNPSSDNGSENGSDIDYAEQKSCRFEFNNRKAPGQIYPEQHLSLLLFLNDLLNVLIDPNSETSCKWRLDSLLPQVHDNPGCFNILKMLMGKDQGKIKIKGRNSTGSGMQVAGIPKIG